MILVAFIFLSTLCFSQLSEPTLRTMYGGSGYDALVDVQFYQGNYYVLSHSRSIASLNKLVPHFGDSHIWLIVTDSNFVNIRQRSFGGGDIEIPTSMIIQNDRIYIAAKSNSGTNAYKSTTRYGIGPEDYDVWVICLSLTGQIIWQKNYGGSALEESAQLIAYDESSILLFCTSTSPAGSGVRNVERKGSSDIWLLRLDALNGTVLQEKSLGGAGEEGGFSVNKDTVNDVFLLAVSSTSPPSFDKQSANPIPGMKALWYFVLNKDLEITSQNVLGGSGPTEAGELIKRPGGYYLSASIQRDENFDGQGDVDLYYSVHETSDAWIAQLDEDLHLIWQETFGSPANDQVAKIFVNEYEQLVVNIWVSLTANAYGGNYLLENHPGKTSLWVVVLDQVEGRVVIQGNHGSSSEDFIQILPIHQHTLKLFYGGHSLNPFSIPYTIDYYDFQILLAKYDMTMPLHVDPLDIQVFGIFPNPTSQGYMLTLQNYPEALRLNLFTVDGKFVSSDLIPAGTTTYFGQIDGTSGLYIYQLVGIKNQVQGLIIKE